MESLESVESNPPPLVEEPPTSAAPGGSRELLDWRRR